MDDLFNSSFFHSYLSRMNSPPCTLDDSMSLNDSNSSSNTIFSNCSAPAFNDFLDFDLQSNFEYQKPSVYIIGLNLFSYFTPFILVIGLIGNGLSLAVFTSKNMRKMSASSYLAALSAADICTLIFYVFIEWLRRGLVHINPDADILLNVLNRDGPCQVFLFLSYISRVMSTWIIVVFTIERFTGVCYPLKSFKGKSKKILIGMLIIGGLLVLYKPILSGEYIKRGQMTCSSNPMYSFESFVLDSIFALLITLVPFIVITILNIMIMRTLYLRNYRHRELFAETTKIRLEFTFILLAISFFFIAFNLPYSAVWFRNFMSSKFKRFDTYNFNYKDIDYWNGVLLVTRTVFYMNYCVNFFLYSITGAYFRNELALMLRFKQRKNRIYKSHIRSSRFGSSNHSGTIATYMA
ncbi:G-protein coupled estrogen receptor 1-like [Ruditapes philippinarum]|uniref:G-protein coupled estrogen receptor 1-like n=1 Tax=Ruditapes philippinarum TaxID=129788 RepID=UPI00295C25BA|nr:G-protein coupled estrogen receptor 1-like [Ruditapes philippinarum]